ncbi:MAG: beta-lactamase family protein [Saprospiraceae bacterium]|nr:beta-lactamase family protein [Saprospiraceae bacterium]
MKNIFTILFSLLAFAITGGCQGQENGGLSTKDKNLNHIDSLLKDWNNRDLFHGGIVISHEGEIVYENYLGFADRTWNIPVTSDVKFDIASLNKSMTAALIMKAVEEGKLDLEDKLSDVLTSFSFNGSFDKQITIHQLLCHTSGLGDYNQVGADLKAKQSLKLKRLRFTNAEYVDFISKLPTVAAPGTQFHYSNFAYHLLAIILEETYQMSFRQILKEKLTQPLGLSNTLSADNNEQIIAKLATGYQYDDQKEEWMENSFIDLSLGRRIFSTAADLNRWALVMDNPGYLSKNSLQLIKKNHLEGISDQLQYGYGWVIVEPGKESKMGNLDINQSYIIHGGRTEGYKSMLINIANGEWVISFLSNVGDRTNEMEIAKQIAHIIIN